MDAELLERVTTVANRLMKLLRHRAKGESWRPASLELCIADIASELERGACSMDQLVAKLDELESNERAAKAGYSLYVREICASAAATPKAASNHVRLGDLYERFERLLKAVEDVQDSFCVEVAISHGCACGGAGVIRIATNRHWLGFVFHPCDCPIGRKMRELWAANGRPLDNDTKFGAQLALF